MMLLAALTLACVLGGAVAETNWRGCGQGAFNVASVTLAPENIYAGNTARFTITAEGGASDVSAGKIEMAVKLAGFPIYAQEDDLCAKTTCPIAKGTSAEIVYEETFPVYTPPGPYSVALSGKNSEGDSLFCVEVSFDVQIPQQGFISDKLGKVARLFGSRKAAPVA